MKRAEMRLPSAEFRLCVRANAADSQTEYRGSFGSVLEPADEVGLVAGKAGCRERIGGILTDDDRDAA